MKKIFLLLYSFLTCSYVNAQEAFITTWEVELFDLNIMIPTSASQFTYDYTVDFGDGTILTNQTGNITHVYDLPGTYTVSISGIFPHFKGSDLSDPFSDVFISYKLKTVEQWGDIEWLSMDSMFRGISFLTLNATDAPDLSAITSLRYMFRSASQFNSNVNHWDVSTITNLEGTFGYTNNFNQPLDNWDVSNVTNFNETFNLAKGFNQNINNWDVSSATTMERMFGGAIIFNQTLGDWDVSNVTNFGSMFSHASNFNQNINSWDISNATSTRQMFAYAYKYNQPLNSWNVSNVTNMDYMFKSSKDFNQALDNWDVSNVTSMVEMFNTAEKFNQPINNWDVSNVTNMKEMFKTARVFNQTLTDWDVFSVTEMQSMFNGAREFNQEFNNWDVSNVTNMQSMFANTRDFNQNINDWDVSNVTTMNGMFSGARSFNQSLSNWDISSVTSIFGMFRFADDFNQDLSNWNFSTGNLQNLFDFSSMSKENFDLIIDMLANSNISNGTLGAFQIQYCNEERIQELLDKGWTINDNGQHDSCNLNIEDFTKIEINISPNPVRDKLKLIVPNNILIYTIELYDIKGNRLSNYSNEDEIDMSQYPQGMYFLKVHTDNIFYKFKIIKK